MAQARVEFAGSQNVCDCPALACRKGTLAAVLRESLMISAPSILKTNTFFLFLDILSTQFVRQLQLFLDSSPFTVSLDMFLAIEKIKRQPENNSNVKAASVFFDGCVRPPSLRRATLNRWRK